MDPKDNFPGISWCVLIQKHIFWQGGGVRDCEGRVRRAAASQASAASLHSQPVQPASGDSQTGSQQNVWILFLVPKRILFFGSTLILELIPNRALTGNNTFLFFFRNELLVKHNHSFDILWLPVKTLHLKKNVGIETFYGRVRQEWLFKMK